MGSPRRVLVIGYRSGLSRALKRLKIPCSLWGRCPPKVASRFESLLTDPIFHSRSKIESSLEGLKAFGPFTHVIAGTEEAVFPASVARRFFQARRSKDTVIIKCHDKLWMKSALSNVGIPMTPFIPYDETLNPETTLEQLGSPVVVKYRKSSGGRGLHLAATPEEVKRYLRPQTLLEKYVDAPEGSVESFIDDQKICFTNVTQYLVKTHVNLVPSHYSESVVEGILELNRRVIKALNIQWGLTHMEFYLTKEGPLFGEIALRPPGGYIMDLIQRAYRFDPWEAYIRMELGEAFSFPTEPERWTAAHVLHPGEGKVLNIVGQKTVENLLQLRRFRLRLDVGDTVPPRVGVGEEVGHILLEDASQAGLMAGVEQVKNQFEIRIEPTS